MLMILISTIVHAQERPFCIINSTTHPFVSPSAEQVASLPMLNNQPDLRFINEWPWWQDPLNSDWDNSVPLNNMQLNAASPYDSSMEPINSSIYSGHYNYLSWHRVEVMHPSGGWELLAFNNGWYPDNETEVDWSQNSALRSIPYLLFYNKFNGIARVFFRYGNNTDPALSIDYASIELFYENPNEMSGLLRLGDGLDRTLDQRSIITKLLARVPSPGQSDIWFSTDFQLAYDPCVCYYSSKLRLQFTFFTEADLEVFGTAITATEELTSESYMSDPTRIHEFLSSSDYSQPDSARNGALIYKTMTDMLIDYEERLKSYKKKLQEVNQTNAEIDKTEAIIKIAKVALSLGVTAVTGMPEYSSLLSLIPSVKAMKDSGTFGADAQKAFWKALDKALLTGFDLMVKDDLKRKSAPEEPSMPTASFTEMRFSGTLTYKAPRPTYPMSTPGAKRSNDINVDQPTTYPLYDDALGVFALLERPKFRISKNIKNQSSWTALSTVISSPDVESHYQSWTVEYQFQIDDPLKFYINPSLNIVKSSIDAALEVKSSHLYQQGWSESHFSCFVDPHYTVNRSSNQIDMSRFQPIKTDVRGFNNGDNFVCSIPGTPYQPFQLSCAELIVPETDFPYITTVSEFVPLDAFQNFYSSIGLKNQYFNQRFISNVQVNLATNPFLSGYVLEHELYLKLLVSVEFEGARQNGEPNAFTYLFTYKVLPEDITIQPFPLHPNLPGSSQDITQHPENLLFNGTSLNGAPIDGCSLDGNTYFCKAWNDISLLGNITVANNHEVIFEAGNEVVVFPDATVPTEATLRLNSPFDFSDPMPMATAEYVTNFCSGLNPKYMANQDRFSATSPQDSLHQAAVFAPQAQQAFAFDVYPNPTNNSAQVKLSLPSNAITTLRILELSGKVVSTPIENAMLSKGDVLENLPSESLLPGIYLIQVTVDEQRFVKRFIKL